MNDSEIDRKLSDLMKNHISLKFKSEKKNYQELLNYTIQLEIKNNELERKFENPMKDQHKIRKLRSFIDSIEPCKSKNQKWVTTDVCLKRKECLVEKKTPFTLRASLNYALDHSACRCKPGQTICEENFCTKNKEVCNNFKIYQTKRFKPP